MVLQFLVAFSITFILMENKLPYPFSLIIEGIKIVRFFSKMLSCSFCTGFWAGLISFGIFHLQEPVFSLDLLRDWLCFGLASSPVCYFFYTIIDYLETASSAYQYGFYDTED